MITKEQVTNLIEAKIAGTDMFIVEVNVRPGNVIEVTMDGDRGITIEACTDIHRHLLHEMDREVEDYSLEVSSPDLMKPLKVLRQYVKNIGRTISVKMNDKSKVEGELRGADESGITLFTSAKEVVPGTKKKTLVEKEVNIPFTDIAETKIVISFK
jgi:ribosome maturation factor RimP